MEQRRPETCERGVTHEVSRSESQPRARWTLRHRCILGAALAIEVLVFSTVSFAIAYAISNAAIRQAGEDLAASMVDTVTARIGTYVNQSEALLLDVVRTARLPGYQLPSDDPDAPGGWSLKWTLALRARMATTQFRINTVSVIFDDGGVAAVGRWWNNRSWIYTVATAHNVPPPPVPCNNCSDLEWSIAVMRDERPVMNVSHVDVFRTDSFASWDPNIHGLGWQPLRMRDARAAMYFTLVRTFGRRAWCSWTRPEFRTFQLPGEFFLTAHCGIVNASNFFLGVATVECTMSDLQNFLDDTATTPNTAMFIIDNFGYLVASTLDVPFVKILAPNESVPSDLPYSCLNSSDVSPYTPQRVGCHHYFADYPYAPLQEIALNVIFTRNTVQHYGLLAGANYYYVSTRIPSNFLPRYTMNLVLLLPEADVVGEAAQRLVPSIIICFSLCIVGTVFANLLVHWLARSVGSSASVRRQRSDRHASLAIDRPPSDNLQDVRTVSKAYADVLVSIRQLAGICSGPIAVSLTLLAADNEISKGTSDVQ